jgi:hypothetical protein
MAPWWSWIPLAVVVSCAAISAAALRRRRPQVSEVTALAALLVSSLRRRETEYDVAADIIAAGWTRGKRTEEKGAAG